MNKYLISYGKLTEREVVLFDEMDENIYSDIGRTATYKVRTGDTATLDEIKIKKMNYEVILKFDSKEKDQYNFLINNIVKLY